MHLLQSFVLDVCGFRGTDFWGLKGAKEPRLEKRERKKRRPFPLPLGLWGGRRLGAWSHG